MKTLLLQSLAIATLVAAGTHAYAGEETLDIDTRFRAKIAKEKLKSEFQQRKAEALANSANGASQQPTCGSQTIGNIDTDGRIGATPREVFVFAPNAINLVTANGCH